MADEKDILKIKQQIAALDKAERDYYTQKLK